MFDCEVILLSYLLPILQTLLTKKHIFHAIIQYIGESQIICIIFILNWIIENKNFSKFWKSHMLTKGVQL